MKEFCRNLGSGIYSLWWGSKYKKISCSGFQLSYFTTHQIVLSLAVKTCYAVFKIQYQIRHLLSLHFNPHIRFIISHFTSVSTYIYIFTSH